MTHGLQAAFDPSRITSADLAFNYDAQRIIADGDAAADGDTILTWQNHGSQDGQAEDVGVGIFRTNILNGRPGVFHDGTGSAPLTQTGITTIVQPYTIFTVSKRTGGTNGEYFHLVFWSGDGGGAAGSGPAGSAGNNHPLWMNAGTSTTSTYESVSNHTILGCFIFDNTASAIYVNGEMASNGGDFSWPVRDDRVNSAGTNDLAGDLSPAGTAGWHGYIHQVLIYDDRLSAADMKFVTDGLRRYWGMS